MAESNSNSSRTSGRLASLDAFRGLTMMSMVLVNNPGNWDHVYPPLLHADWHGCTFTDLIFPFFLFIVGTSMAFSFSKRLREGGRTHLYIQLIRRSLIIFALGLILNLLAMLDGDTMRIPGVLQRIALCYFFVGWMVLNLNTFGLWTAGFALLLIYSIGMLWIPVPGHGAGVFDPVGNFCWWLDTMILQGYTWQYAPVAGFDPEGVWSTLPAIVTTLLGYKAGLALRSDRPHHDKLIDVFTSANVCLIVCYLTTAIMPVNKQLWTVPYVLLTAGLAFHALGMLYYWVDLKGCRLGLTPALVYGSNAIFIYVGSSIGGAIWNSNHSVYAIWASWFSPKNASLITGLVYVALWLGIAAILYRKRIFMKV